MTGFSLRRAFGPIKAHAPTWFSGFVRSAGTALLTPVRFSLRTGHWRSSFARLPLSRRGTPLPWYTYPCIDFLASRSHAGRSVLEFGAGYSTLWWAARAARVVALEADEEWLATLRRKVPENVALQAVPGTDANACIAAVNGILNSLGHARFDVVVIDGLCRSELIDVAARSVTDDGIVLCDNAEGYGIQEGFRGRDFQRVDFFGYAPGVILPHCTSLFFRTGAYVFAPTHPIPDITRNEGT